MADSTDEIEVCQSVGPHELVEAVKSKAVVKFSAVQVPVKFNRLECNTNLNLPPSNWLTTSDSSGLHQALYQSPGFASFRMAHMFPDCVGEVDVVSDAENIKKLLKLPYSSKSAVSMIVHKVGNTLLLDEFDIQKYLLRKADDDWKWLRTFILEQLMAYGEKDHNFCFKDKSREAIQSKNLLSKFLYHSLKQSGSESSEQQAQHMRPPLPITGPVLPEPKVEENVPDPKSSHTFNRNVLWTFEDIRMLIGTDMPIFGGPNRPCISLRLRDMAKPINVLTGIDYWLDNLMCNVPEVVMCYHLDGIVQKYEIIKTEDLPYLEDSQFSPQVVRNVAQNILAFLKVNATKEGHTYWLFKGRNDDVVKLYDLTTLCKNQTAGDEKQENPFTVPVAMLLYTVARNMKNTAKHITPQAAGNIRALLDNCIKLLPKEKYPQIVTSSHYILSDLHVPAGIDPKSPKFDTSDMDSDTQSVYEEEEDMGNEDEINFGDFSKELSENVSQMRDNVAVKNICDTLKEFHFEPSGKTGNRAPRAPVPLVASIEERCRIALQHISAGISCLQFFNSNEEKFIKETEERAKDEEKLRILHEEQNPNMAKPFKPIPLPYVPLGSRLTGTDGEGCTEVEEEEKEQNVKKSSTKPRRNKFKDVKENIKPEASAAMHQLQPHQVATNFNSQLFGSWNVHLKLLLLEKACLTYATLAEYEYVAQRYGASLKAIYLSCHCQVVVMKYMSSMKSQMSCLLGRAGDCFFQMAKNWEAIDDYLDQFNESNDVDINIIKELDKDLSDEDMLKFIAPTKNVEQIMTASCRSYENALEAFSTTTEVDDDAYEILRRMGNVHNELGLKYMYWAQEEYSKSAETRKPTDGDSDGKASADTKEEEEVEPVYIKLAMRSYDCLLRGIHAFQQVKDKSNLAFLYCNMGRFMRFRAHLQLPEENADFVQRQKRFYSEAFTYYEKAKDVLESRKNQAELWDSVNWELSTATFTLAKQLQDFSTADEFTKAELEKEVLDLLQKSLKLCDVENPGSQQILYTYRSGLIHKRIASFHYSQLRRSCTECVALPKTTIQLCKYHYEKAASILDNLKEEGTDHLIVQIERISLQELLMETSTHRTQKIKHMQAALEICLNSKSVFEHALTMSSAVDCSITPATVEEFQKLMVLFESRLQNALKTLVKLLLSGKDPKKMAELYKMMYRETLFGANATGEQKPPLACMAQKLVQTLEKLNALELAHEHGVIQ